MRAVVDTNILIRSLLKPLGTVGPIISRLRDGDYILVYSALLLDELVEKLALPRIRKKYRLEESQIEALVALIALRGERVAPDRKVKVCRDPDDDMFIEAALSGMAKHIVTGDEDLLVLEKKERKDAVSAMPAREQRGSQILRRVWDEAGAGLCGLRS